MKIMTSNHTQAAGKGVDWAQKRTEPKHTFSGPE